MTSLDLRSGWSRLFVVVWVGLLTVFGYRLHRLRRLEDFHAEVIRSHDTYRERHPYATVEVEEYEKRYEESLEHLEKEREPYENVRFHFYVFGLAAPPVVALAAWWVSKGFRRIPT